MKRVLLAIVFALLAATAVVADGARGIPFKINEAGVIESLNDYVLDFNKIVEYAPVASCNATVADPAALAADVAIFMQKHYSDKVRSFITVQSTKGNPGPFVGVNWTVGQAQFPNSSALKSFLGQAVYVGLPTGSTRAPFWWTLSAPVVQQINWRDPDYDGAITAVITANNQNQGYRCRSGVLVWRMQFNQYVHKMIYNADLDNWQFVEFMERNNGQVIQDASLYTRLNP